MGQIFQILGEDVAGNQIRHEQDIHLASDRTRDSFDLG